MGMKPRVAVELEFDPWCGMKPEDYSCHVPWETDWQRQEASISKEFKRKVVHLPMPGVLLPEPDAARPHMEMWRLLGHFSGCGHWTEHPEGGEMCGVFMNKKSAENALCMSASGVCWECLMKAWEPILGKFKESDDGKIRES
jgi:hypothetical protein